MSNEIKDWLWDKFAEVLFDAKQIDQVLTIIPYENWYAIVHGLKDGIHVKYNVWFDDEEGWNYERSES